MRFNEKVEGRRRKTEFDLAEFVFEKEDHRESKNPEYRVIKFFFFFNICWRGKLWELQH